jgi:hypothetical protein
MKEIKLTQGKVALVSNEDYEFLNKYFTWHACEGRGHYYARTSFRKFNKCVSIRMHQLIIDRIQGGYEDDGLETDHIDGDTLNNCRRNLRKVTHNLNMQNRRFRNTSSKYRGVCWHKIVCKWQANITINYKKIHIGYYYDEMEAAKAYDKKAVEIYGADAVTNF